MSSHELAWLRDTAAQMSSVIEIGSWKGRSTFALLEGCRGPVYAVDHWLGSWDERTGTHSEALTCNMFHVFMGNVGHFPNLKAIRMDSLDAAECLPDVDMIFIDGCHQYDDVVQDLKAWRQKAKKLLCGHDFNYESVKKALKEEVGEVTNVVESLWAFETSKEYRIRPYVRPPLKPLRVKLIGMDKRCEVCTQTTDDSEGKCRFCGTPFPEDPAE